MLTHKKSKKERGKTDPNFSMLHGQYSLSPAASWRARNQYIQNLLSHRLLCSTWPCCTTIVLMLFLLFGGQMAPCIYRRTLDKNFVLYLHIKMCSIFFLVFFFFFGSACFCIYLNPLLKRDSECDNPPSLCSSKWSAHIYVGMTNY
jgi:hypothetical protein